METSEPKWSWFPVLPYMLGPALPSGFSLGFVEGSDLSELTELLHGCFKPPYMRIIEEDFSALELFFLKPMVYFFNTFTDLVARLEIGLGLRSRVGRRLKEPTLKPSKDSLILGVQDATTSELIGAVELCLLAPEGAVVGNFRSIFFRLDPVRMRPYLCNLAIAESYRRRGLGRRLVDICEKISKDAWGYSEIYLHADGEDEAASTLYDNADYRVLPDFDPPQWYTKFLGLPNIRYRRKFLNDSSISVNSKRSKGSSGETVKSAQDRRT